MRRKVQKTLVWICGFGSLSNRTLPLYLVFIFFSQGISFAQSHPWRLSSKLSAKINVQELQNKYHTIDNPEQLQTLLQDLGKLHPFVELYAEYKEANWVVSGEIAEFIYGIEIEMVTNFLEHELSGVKQKFIGKVDSDSTRRKVVENVLLILRTIGYSQANIDFNFVRKSDGIVYHLVIDEGDHCLIRNVQLPFQLPDDTELSVKRGDVCDLNKVKGAILELEDELLNIGYRDLRLQFSNLEYISDGKYADVIIHGDLGKKIIYEVEDESKQFFIDDILSDEIFEDKDIQTASPEAMTAELYKFYRNQGYEDVEIEGPIRKREDDNVAVYVFYINPGIRYIISSLRFDGNRIFSSEELRDIWGYDDFWSTSAVLNRDQFAQGITAIESLYRKNGYWDVKVRNPRIIKDKINGTAQMVILISEGKQRIVERVTLKGNKVFSDEKIRSMLDAGVGDLLAKEELLTFENRLRERYLNHGYHYVQVSIRISSKYDFRNIPSNVIVNIQEGKRVKIGKINIIGLVKTEKVVVERELLFESGDWYNPSQVSQSRAELVNLGIFKSVQISPTDRAAYLDKSSILDLTVEVFEGNAGNIVFGPGYNYQRGVLYVSEFTYNNIAGTGRQFSLRTSVSEEKNQAAISSEDSKKGKVFLGRKLGIGYVEPFIFNFPIDARLSISHKATADDFWKIGNSMDTSLAYKTKDILPGVVLSPFYNFRFNKEEGSQVDDLLLSTGNSTIGSMGLRIDYDGRDELGWPTMGEIVQMEAGWARNYFGGSFRFFKWDLFYKKFTKIFSNLVWTNSFHFTAFEGVERNDGKSGWVLPSSERLQANGVNRVRGFEQKLGPYARLVENGNVTEKKVTGGTKRAIFKTEIRHKINSFVGSSFFIDCGNTFFSQHDFRQYNQLFNDDQGEGLREIKENISYEFRDLISSPGYLFSRNYLSYGSSVSLITPVGPINVFISWPWKEPKSHECERDSSICFTRSGLEESYIKRFQIDINIGSEF